MKSTVCLSPTKQNLNSSKIAVNRNQLFRQIINFLKKEQIKLPMHLEKIINQNSQQYLTINKSCLEDVQIKQLKLKLSDNQFERKKLEEDFAQFRRISKQEKDKQVKKLEQAYKKLESISKVNEQDQKFQFHKLKSQFEIELQQTIKKNKALLEQQISKRQKQTQNKVSILQKLKQREVNDLIQKQQQIVKKMQKQFKTIIQNTQKDKEEEIKKILIKGKKTLEQKQKQFQSFYVALQSEKKTEQKMHQTTKIDTSKVKRQLQSELYYERNVKKQLEQEIFQKDKLIKALKGEIKDKQAIMEINQIKYLKQLKNLSLQMCQSINRLKEQHINEQKSLLNDHYCELQRLEQQIMKLQELKKEGENQWVYEREDMLAKLSEKSSRKQDLEQLEKFRIKINRKEEEIKKLQNELKSCNLEIQNKEQTYNKIFKAHSTCKYEKNQMKKIEDKMTLVRDRENKHSRETLFRKSQTADIKYLLKVYNKNF